MPVKSNLPRDKNGRVLPGPGYPAGRRKVLGLLDSMLSKEGNLHKLRESFQAEFDKDPAKFFRRYIMPLIPRNVRMTNLTHNVENLLQAIQAEVIDVTPETDSKPS